MLTTSFSPSLVFLLFALLGTVIVHCTAVEEVEEEEAEAGGVLSVEHFKTADDGETQQLHREVRAAKTTKKATSRKPSTTRRNGPSTTRRPPTSKRATSRKPLSTSRRPSSPKGPGGKGSTSPKPRPPVKSTPKPPTKLPSAGNSVRK